MVYNMAVIVVSLLWQPHDPVLTHDLASQFIPMLVRPVGVQLLVAFVSFLWVSGMNQAAKRADKAEMIAKLEHELADQKQELEAGIQQLQDVHVTVANGDLSARAPLSQGNVLWQVASALNTLLVRFQRASLAEREVHRVEEAVKYHVQGIQRAKAYRQPVVLPMTRTIIDPLIAELQGQTITYTPISTQDTNAFDQRTR